MARKLVIFLHAHLPDCRRPDHPASLEETWFIEALVECYLPLVRMLDRLIADRVPFGLTLSLSPTLICMLQDPALLKRSVERIRRTIELASRDAETANDPHRSVALWHAAFYNEMLDLFEQRCVGDLLAVLKEFQEQGTIELATTAATHAILPFYQAHPSTVRAQIGIGIDTFHQAMGATPSFFWLPECAYYPGLDHILAEFGVRAFGLESHGVLKANPPAPDLHRPIACESGLRAMGRAPDFSQLVWSAQDGYPGNPAYREFHRDRINELAESEIVRWLDGYSTRLPSGLKYWRVTGPQEEKKWYDPASAHAQANIHARDFVQRLKQISENEGIWFIPFDAELFGHWWFEGPLWLEAVFRHLAAETESRMQAYPVTKAVLGASDPFPSRPATSSWGEAGDFSFWINEDTAWIFPRLIEATGRFDHVLSKHASADPDSLQGRTLRQAARTLLLAQSSDWPFLLKANTSTRASRDWIEGLLGRFSMLCKALEMRAMNEDPLAHCEAADACFPHLDLRYFQT